MKRKKIAYLSHVPWGFIKQRPQFLAEQLAKEFHVDYIELKGVRSMLKFYLRDNYNAVATDKFTLRVRRRKNINVYKIHNSLMLFVANLINAIWGKSFDSLKQYDYIWITHPQMYSVFKKQISKDAYIIYDCMDDALAFKNDARIVLKINESEEELVKRAKVIICSSEHLKTVIIRRYSVKNVSVVNNAISKQFDYQNNLNLKDIKLILDQLSTISYPLVYIGAISDWFDFDLMEKILDKFNYLTLVLVGPCEIEIPQHQQILHFPSVSHKYIFPIMDKAFALVMPFKVNELIESVNPVKLYEYIYMGKHILAPLYGESSKFKDFVHLYNSQEDFEGIILDIINNRLSAPDIDSCRSFVNRNTWDHRFQKIRELLLNE